MAREGKAQTDPAPVHRYLRHRRAVVPRHGHLPIAAGVKRGTWRSWQARIDDLSFQVERAAASGAKRKADAMGVIELCQARDETSS